MANSIVSTLRAIRPYLGSAEIEKRAIAEYIPQLQESELSDIVTYWARPNSRFRVTSQPSGVTVDMSLPYGQGRQRGFTRIARPIGDNIPEAKAMCARFELALSSTAYDVVLNAMADDIAQEAFSLLLSGHYEVWIYFHPSSEDQYGELRAIGTYDQDYFVEKGYQLVFNEPIRGNMTKPRIKSKVREACQRLPILPY